MYSRYWELEKLQKLQEVEALGLTAQEGQCQKRLATGSCWPLLELGTGEAVCTAGACQSSTLEPGSKTLFLSQCPSNFLPLSNLKHQEAFVITHRNSGAFGLGGSDSVKLWLQSSFWPGLQSSEGPTAVDDPLPRWLTYVAGKLVMAAGIFSTCGHLHRDA